jgi:hypothetical protein
LNDFHNAVNFGKWSPIVNSSLFYSFSSIPSLTTNFTNHILQTQPTPDPYSYGL